MPGGGKSSQAPKAKKQAAAAMKTAAKKGGKLGKGGKGGKPVTPKNRNPFVEDDEALRSNIWTDNDDHRRMIDE